MGNENRWFVRADKDAPLKGPYTRDKIEQSYAKGLLKPGSLLEPEVASESTSKYKTVKDLAEEGVLAKEEKRAKMMTEFRQQEAEADARHARSSGNGQMMLGVLMLLVGGGATAATCSSGGSHVIVFTGLIVGGVIQLIRGAGNR